MKAIFTLIFSFITLTTFAQSPSYLENFEAPNHNYISLFTIDTVNYHHNIWQIGRPQKTVFDSAYSYPNAIVTDTLNHYPVNDTSVFLIKTEKFSSGPPGIIYALSFKYKLDIDSGEIAKVELSGDSGLHWVNPLLQDTTYYMGWAGAVKPNFSHSTSGWATFGLSFLNWGGSTNFPHDSLYIRFTFISDSVQSNKDGWMMDNFYLDYYWEGITKIDEGPIAIYPNPSAGDLHIKPKKTGPGKSSAIIYNLQGIEVYRCETLPAAGNLHLKLPDGLYQLKYISGDNSTVQKLIIRN